jgi:hypothetical protein
VRKCLGAAAAAASVCGGEVDGPRRSIESKPTEALIAIALSRSSSAGLTHFEGKQFSLILYSFVLLESNLYLLRQKS